MEGGDVPVTLIIKAPTQQINDQTIQCARSWTVERLKRHIADVYPNNPPPSEQRLIYYGQLLCDGETLQEVLTRFEEGETVHTVHLVCMANRESTQRVPMPPSSTAPASAPQGQVPAPAAPHTADNAYRFYMNAAGYEPWMNEANPAYFQQLAWAQHAYANYYFSQYMDMMARQQGAQGMYAAAEGEGGGEVARVPEPAPPQRPEDDDRNRDWLDYIYMMARVVVLFSIVYFYSSPARFLVVSFLAIVLYLYQVGFFRVQNIPIPENNEILNNNLAQENNNLAHAQAQPEEADVGGGGEAESGGQPADATPAPDHPRPTLLALSWTFLSSFFASLIPENVNAV